MQETKSAPKMDESFSADTKVAPEKTPLEMWHGGGVVKGKKINGHFETEEGTSILIDGWRAIEKPVKEKPAKKTSAPARRKR